MQYNYNVLEKEEYKTSMQDQDCYNEIQKSSDIKLDECSE